MEFPRQRVGFPLFTPTFPVAARKHETLSDSPGRKHEPILLCDSQYDLQPNLHHMTVEEEPRGKLKRSRKRSHVNLFFSVYVRYVVCEGRLTIHGYSRKRSSSSGEWSSG